MIDVSGKEHIIFDFDGTLFWLDLDWDRYFDLIAEELRRLDAGLYQAYLDETISWGNMQNQYVSQFGPDVLEMIKRNNVRAEQELFREAVPNHDLIRFARGLSDSVTRSIWSSNCREVISDVLASHGLLQDFPVIVDRSSVTQLKPFDDGFAHIHAAGTGLETYLMIGNSEADRRAAANAGIDFHLVTMDIPAEKSLLPG